ncbi:MAG TPA: hypothetical protein VG965_02380 [Patescibacteria group bacterium]|nr:hypothetical protein [Patescibacteria group bacterium]
MNKIIAVLLSVVLFGSVATSAFASGESNCQPIYGGGQVCQNNLKFTINKLVQKPGTNNYVDNLTINDPRYNPSTNVTFKISITNTGNTEIDNLNVVDNFPQYLTFVAGVGNTNVGASQINFTIGKITAGQTLDFLITAKTADAGNLPNNQAITCVTNNVVATANDGTQASDNAQLCIEKSIPGTTTTTTTTNNTPILSKPTITTIPSTGPETDILFGLIGSGSLGYFLRRKTN